MRRRRILVVSDADSSFVRTDVELLGAFGDVDFFRYRGRKDLLRLLAAIVGADLIVAWFVLGFATTSVLLGRLLRTPVILVVGGWDVVAVPEIGYGAMTSPDRIRKTRVALRSASRVLAVSESTRRETLQWVDREVDVLYNAVDTDFFRPEGQRSAQVVTVGGVSNDAGYRKKGLDVFLRVAGRMPEVRFVHIGRNAEPWEGKIRRASPANVELMGFVTRERLREAYRRSAVYAQLSYHESFGVSLVEAMACGCAAVVTDRAALPEIVGGAGRVVPYGDVDATVRTIREALVDPDSGARARDRAVEAFSVERRKEGWRRAIEQVT